MDRYAHRNVLKGKTDFAHFSELNYYSEDDWEVGLIDQTDVVEELRKRQSFWQHELNTFHPNGLNEREAALF